MRRHDPVGAVVAANLKYMRISRGWKLKETGKRLGRNLGREKISESAMSRWENRDSPRRFSMTELFAICRTFEIPLARLFLPNRDADIPKINDLPFHAVWSACFSGTERLLPDWQLVEQDELHPPGNSQHPFSDRPEAEAMEHLRRTWPPLADDGATGGDE